MKRVTCQSGLKGYKCHLRDNYVHFAEFRTFSELYGLHTRLGFATPKEAWEVNPEMEGSVTPSDFRNITTK
jgi:hypothetical protein